MFLTILSLLVAGGFLASGVAKVRPVPWAVGMSRRWGMEPEQIRLMGILEILFAVLVLLGLWTSWMGTFGSLMLTFVAAVWVLMHVRVADPPPMIVPPAVLGILAFILFQGHLYL